MPINHSTLSKLELERIMELRIEVLNATGDPLDYDLTRNRLRDHVNDLVQSHGRDPFLLSILADEEDETLAALALYTEAYERANLKRDSLTQWEVISAIVELQLDEFESLERAREWLNKGEKLFPAILEAEPDAHLERLRLRARCLI